MTRSRSVGSRARNLLVAAGGAAWVVIGCSLRGGRGAAGSSGLRPRSPAAPVRLKLALWIQPLRAVGQQALVVAGEVVAVAGAGLRQPGHQVEHAREDPVAQQGPGDGSGRVDRWTGGVRTAGRGLWGHVEPLAQLSILAGEGRA